MTDDSISEAKAVVATLPDKWGASSCIFAGVIVFLCFSAWRAAPVVYANVRDEQRLDRELFRTALTEVTKRLDDINSTLKTNDEHVMTAMIETGKQLAEIKAATDRIITLKEAMIRGKPPNPYAEMPRLLPPSFTLLPKPPATPKT